MNMPFRNAMVAAAQAVEAALPKGARFVLVAIDMQDEGETATISNIPNPDLAQEVLRMAGEATPVDAAIHRQGEA